MAMLVGPDAPLVVDMRTRASHASHVWDFFKPDMSSEYPQVHTVVNTTNSIVYKSCSAPPQPTYVSSPRSSMIDWVDSFTDLGEVVVGCFIPPPLSIPPHGGYVVEGLVYFLEEVRRAPAICSWRTLDKTVLPSRPVSRSNIIVFVSFRHPFCSVSSPVRFLSSAPIGTHRKGQRTALADVLPARPRRLLRPPGGEKDEAEAGQNMRCLHAYRNRKR